MKTLIGGGVGGSSLKWWDVVRQGRHWSGRAFVLSILAASLFLMGTGAHAQTADVPDTVTVPGTIQSHLGCPGDWQPGCSATFLALDGNDGIWKGAWELPAGDYEYKVAINQSWDENYGLNAESYGPNIPLSVGGPGVVRFYYDHESHWITDSINDVIATVVGSFQSELGCGGDWDPRCLRSWLQDPDGDGVYTFTTWALPAGTFQAKVAINESVDEVYGLDGLLDGAEIAFTVPEDGREVYFGYDPERHMLTISTEGAPKGDLRAARAHWVARDTIAWDIDKQEAKTFTLHYDLDGGLELSPRGVLGGEAIELLLDKRGLSEEIKQKFPHLREFAALRIASDDLGLVSDALKGQTAVSALDGEGKAVDATALQLPGVLDDLYTYDGALGVVFSGEVPTLKVWAPTARAVALHLFENAGPDTQAQVHAMREGSESGVWSITGEPDWTGKFYLYEVEVFVPSTGQVENNLVTDPYAVSLSMNSKRSQIVKLDDPTLEPSGWDALEKPALAGPEDIVVYELHVRDFSMSDDSVPADKRGTFLAFTVPESKGMRHLLKLADSGLTHIHLLPVFDIATINEDKARWKQTDLTELSGYPPDSEEQQKILASLVGQDGYNWGYDPFHYTVPEGSYSTTPDGSTRTLEFRQMVQALNRAGLRVVMDVVYNHTNASGQSEKSVLDRIVPGYYHRLNEKGGVEKSTCCENTATEHNMMRKLMVDSVVTWATAYKVDGFRFDLMGHHMVADMMAVQEALQGLTLENAGVDGSKIYVYGEGWDFGEVAKGARGVNATQLNMGDLGIGTFNDRMRDAVRGGTPFGGHLEQGFINGLFYDSNESENRSKNEQKVTLFKFSDQIRTGLAGNLASYAFANWQGQRVTGAKIDYKGSPTGYTQAPQEHIAYISAHDNETLFDAIQYKAPATATLADRVRMQNMGISLVALSQGVPFFHAGVDTLRSKSLDRDSYDSGDWFNKLDFGYQDNNWGVGLPPADKNQSNWSLMRPLLARPELKPSPEDILNSVAHMQEMLRIRKSSPLFRLRTAEEVQERVRFHNTGPNQIPGLIAMSLSDAGAPYNLDPNYELIFVAFNATPEAQTFAMGGLTGVSLELHPVQAGSNDAVMRTAVFDKGTGTFEIPARTTAVFVAPEGSVSEMPFGEGDTIEVVVADAPQATEHAPEATALRTEPAATALEPTAGMPESTPGPGSDASGGGFPVWLWLLALLGIGGGIAAWVMYRRR